MYVVNKIMKQVNAPEGNRYIAFSMGIPLQTIRGYQKKIFQSILLIDTAKCLKDIKSISLMFRFLENLKPPIQKKEKK